MYEIFAQLLKEHNVTPYQVYKATGVTQSSLSDWKNGKSKPKYEKMRAIADYFGVSVDYLLGNEPKEKAPSKIGEGHRPPDEETLRLLEILEDRPDIRYLAAASEKATPEHVEATARMFDELYGRNKDK